MRGFDGVPATVCASVERAQPYSIAPKTPERDGLALLSRLSNVDKHRSLATVASCVAPATFGYSGRVAGERFWVAVPEAPEAAAP